MTPPPTRSAPPARDHRKWLSLRSRSGGVASQMAILLPLVSAALLLPQAWWLAHALHLGIVDRLEPGALVWPVCIVGALLVIRIGLGLSADIAAGTASERIKLGVRRAIAGTILAAQPTWTASRSSGALASAAIEQVDALDGYLTRYMPAMVQAAIVPLAFAVVLLPFDWVVSVLLLIAAPLIPVFMALAGWGAEAASRRQATALSRLSGRFADRLRGITTLKLFGRDEAETHAVYAASEELRIRTMRVMRIAFLSSAVLEFFAALGVAGIALYVGLTFLHLVNLRSAPLALEAGLFCLLMAPEVFQPLRLLAAHYHDQAAAKAAVAEIESQLGALPPIDSPPLALPAMATGKVVPAVALSGVGINAPGGRPVIEDADLRVAWGEHVAILGTSGSGKSTLLEAIAGLRPYNGSIRLDERELSDWPMPLLRAGVGVLGQRPTIFAGSIADNIRLGRRNASAAEVGDAALCAHVMEFAETLPKGLDTMLGEGGLGLSGGEVHRVALARLYLRDPGLLLLDEPTAHLDPATEAAVLDGLLEFAQDRTLIVVTHSAAVAARMDRRVSIAHGRLVPMLDEARMERVA